MHYRFIVGPNRNKNILKTKFVSANHRTLHGWNLHRGFIKWKKWGQQLLSALYIVIGKACNLTINISIRCGGFWDRFWSISNCTVLSSCIKVCRVLCLTCRQKHEANNHTSLHKFPRTPKYVLPGFMVML